MAQSKRALITGGLGFTGRYLAAEMRAAGWEVFELDFAPSPNRDNYFQVNLADLNGLKNVIAQVQPNVVAHLAAIAFVAHGNADEIYNANLIGTRNLLQAIDESGVKPDAILLASSANVYGNSAEGELDETAPINPANDYAVSKAAMEYMAKLWSHKLPIIIARPFNYTGVGQSPQFLIPKIVDHFARKADIVELGNIDVWREFSDVRFVAQVYRQLLENKPLGAVVNVCSGVTYSIRDVLNLAQAITGHAIQIRVNPKFVRDNEIKSLSGNPRQLQSLIGQLPTFTLEQTLRWMFENYNS